VPGNDLAFLTPRDIGDLQATAACLEVIGCHARLAVSRGERHSPTVSARRLAELREAAARLESAVLRLLDDLAPELGDPARDVAGLARAEAEIATAAAPRDSLRIV
jgi:hypothetical protein